MVQEGETPVLGGEPSAVKGTRLWSGRAGRGFRDPRFQPRQSKESQLTLEAGSTPSPWPFLFGNARMPGSQDTPVKGSATEAFVFRKRANPGRGRCPEHSGSL